MSTTHTRQIAADRKKSYERQRHSVVQETESVERCAQRRNLLDTSHICCEAVCPCDLTICMCTFTLKLTMSNKTPLQICPITADVNGTLEVDEVWMRSRDLSFNIEFYKQQQDATNACWAKLFKIINRIMPESEKINNLLELKREITEGRISSILSNKLTG